MPVMRKRMRKCLYLCMKRIDKFMKKVLVFLAAAAVACGCAAPDALKTAVAAQLEAYPASRVLDIYKSFCQDHLGPEHLIPDPESARAYMDSELGEYSADLAAGRYAKPAVRSVPCGDEGNYVRVDLSAVLDGLIPAGTLLDAFVRSANAGQNMTPDEWIAKWQEIKKVILKDFPDIPGAEEDLRELDSLMAEGHLIMHHSQSFSDAYHPHYRIIARKIFEDELAPMLGLKD